MKRICILVITVTILTGIVSCGPSPSPNVYSLTMAVNPADGGTAIDLTGGGPYASGTVVNIVATPADALGYYFVQWSAPAGTFGDPTVETTTFTMPAQNVTVTAHFVGPLDHFRGYGVDAETATSINADVYLEDQLTSINITLEKPLYFCNPVQKLHNDVLTPISNPDHHLTWYDMKPSQAQVGWWIVQVDNQFGTHNLTVYGPLLVAVPTQKVEPGGHEPPLELDHYMGYDVWEGPLLHEESAVLTDQFISAQNASFQRITGFCVPVYKTHGNDTTVIVNPEECLVVIQLNVEFQLLEPDVEINNQFGDQTLVLEEDVALLFVPSVILSVDQAIPPI